MTDAIDGADHGIDRAQTPRQCVEGLFEAAIVVEELSAAPLHEHPIVRNQVAASANVQDAPPIQTPRRLPRRTPGLAPVERTLYVRSKFSLERRVLFDQLADLVARRRLSYSQLSELDASCGKLRFGEQSSGASPMEFALELAHARF